MVAFAARLAAIHARRATATTIRKPLTARIWPSASEKLLSCTVKSAIAWLPAIKAMAMRYGRADACADDQASSDINVCFVLIPIAEFLLRPPRCWMIVKPIVTSDITK